MENIKFLGPQKQRPWFSRPSRGLQTCICYAIVMQGLSPQLGKHYSAQLVSPWFLFSFFKYSFRFTLKFREQYRYFPYTANPIPAQPSRLANLHQSRCICYRRWACIDTSWSPSIHRFHKCSPHGFGQVLAITTISHHTCIHHYSLTSFMYPSLQFHITTCIHHNRFTLDLYPLPQFHTEKFHCPKSPLHSITFILNLFHPRKYIKRFK